MALHPQAQQIAPYIAYEYHRLLQDARELQRLLQGPAVPPEGRCQEEVNRATESLLVHARNIYDLFFVEPQREEDVSFKHFLDDGQTWKPDPATRCPYLHGNRRQLNRLLQHLSYDRIKFKPTQCWDTQTIMKELASVCREFLEQIPERQHWFAPPADAEERHPRLVAMCAEGEEDYPETGTGW
jgi:hypothetical protein